MKKTLFILSALLLSLACTSGQDMALLHREITDVQRSVQQLNQESAGHQDLAKIDHHMKELAQQTTRSNADLSVKVESLQERIEALQSSLELLNRRLQSITQELAVARATPLAVIPPVTSAGEAAETGTEVSPGASTQGQAPAADSPQAPVEAPRSEIPPDQLYKAAYSDYMQGNYDLAIQGFEEYLERFSKTDLADNALFWIGECHAAKKENEKAIEAYSKVLESYPDSDKAAAAQLKKGILYLESGDQSQGVLNLQYVVYEHPGSPEADLAREKLRSLGLNIR